MPITIDPYEKNEHDGAKTHPMKKKALAMLKQRSHEAGGGSDGKDKKAKDKGKA